MSLKTYTITVNGDDNGNVIAQPFTIDVHQTASCAETGASVDEDGQPIEVEVEFTQIVVCTKNATGLCGNSDIADITKYDLVASNLDRDAVLAATIEVALEAAYPGAWS